MPPFHHADTAMKAQTVILAMPPIFGIHQVIAENLRFHGFEVTELIYEEGKFTYANIWQRLKKLSYRNLLRQREYKKEQLFQPYLADFTAKLDQIEGQADYCFMTWPGVFPSSFMQTLRDKSRLMLHYNWETLEFLEHEFYKIKFFDKFMFFDPYDIGRRPEYADKLIPATSFWFDCYLQEEQNDGSLFFIGSHHKERIADIRAFYLAAEPRGRTGTGFARRTLSLFRRRAALPRQPAGRTQSRRSRRFSPHQTPRPLPARFRSAGLR